MSLLGEIKTGLSPLVDLIYPPRCPLCGVPVAQHGGLCIDCWNELEPAGPTTSNTGAQVIAPWLYNDASRQLVLNFKHGGKIALASLMAQMIGRSLADAHGAARPMLVPVPLHRVRLLERGFNQAALLASELAKRGKGDLCLDALIRRKRTPSLGGLGREERQAALKDAVCITPTGKRCVEGKDVVLVDDVYTSGATSGACTQALMAAGARSVQIACFARVRDD